MKKKFLSVILAIFMFVPCMFCLTACDGDDPGDNGGQNIGANTEYLEYTQTCSNIYDNIMNDTVIPCNNPNQSWMSSAYSVVSLSQCEEYPGVINVMTRVVRAYLCVGLGAGELIVSSDNGNTFYDKVLEVTYPDQKNTLFKIEKVDTHLYVYVDDNSTDMRFFADFNIYENGGYDFVSIAVAKDNNGMDVAIGDSNFNFINITTYNQEVSICVYDGQTGYKTDEASLLENAIVSNKVQECISLLETKNSIIDEMNQNIDYSYDYSLIQEQAKKYFDTKNPDDDDSGESSEYSIKLYLDGQLVGIYDRFGYDWREKMNELFSIHGGLDGWYFNEERSQMADLDNLDQYTDKVISIYAFTDFLTTVRFLDENGNQMAEFELGDRDQLEKIWDSIPSVPEKLGYSGKFVSVESGYEISKADSSISNPEYQLEYMPVSYGIVYHNLTDSELEHFHLPFSRSVECGAELIDLNNFSFRDGRYKFVGYYTKDQGGVKIEKVPEGIGEYHVYVKFAPIEYTINYDCIDQYGEESQNTNKVKFTIEDDAFDLQPLTGSIWKEFVGWSLSRNGAGGYITSIDPNDYYGNITIYAIWSYNRYNIEVVDYDVNKVRINDDCLLQGYLEKEDFTLDSDNETLIFALNNPKVKTGYEFKKWIDVDTDTVITQISETDLNKNITIRVKPIISLIQYKITYAGLFGLAVTNPTTYTIEDDDIALSSPTGNRPGYTFDCWQDGNRRLDTENPVIACESGGDRTITAIWKTNNYSITLHYLISVYPENYHYDYSTNCSLYYNYNANIIQYNITQDSISLDVDQNESIGKYRELLMLQREFTFVGFKINNDFVCNDKITTEEAFNNLLINKEGKIITDITISEDMLGDIDLWAVYKIKNYTVKYINTITNTEATVADTLPTTINCFTPMYDLSSSFDTRVGYQNAGWSIGTKRCSYLNGRSIEFAEDSQITLSIAWELLKYRVSYYKCKMYWKTGVYQDTQQYSESDYYTVESSEFALKTPEELETYYINAGYKFVGWTTGPNGTGEKIEKITPGVGENEYHSNINLYDVWEEKDVTVTYHYNDGSEPEKTYTQTGKYYNFIVNTPEDMRTRTDYVFFNWGNTREQRWLYGDYEGRMYTFGNNEDTYDLYAIWDLEIEYELQEDNTFKLTHFRKRDNSEWTVPQATTVNGVTAPVTAIGDDAFECNISRLNLKDSNIKVLGQGAIRGAFAIDGLPKNLESLGGYNLSQKTFDSGKIIIPSSVKKLSAYTFMDCDTEIDFGSATLTEIGEDVFRKYNYSKLVIPELVQKINVKAFDLANITELVLPKDVAMEQVSSSDKINMPKLTKLTASSSLLKYFKNYSAQDAKLKEIVLLDTDSLSNDWSTIGFFQAVEKIDLSAFNGTEIPANAFKNLYLLDNVELPNTITKIGESAFENCYCLSNLSTANQVRPTENGTTKTDYLVDLPNSILELETKAFANCVSIKGLRVGKSIQTIGEGVFSGCASMETLRLQFVGKTRDSKNLETTADNYVESHLLWVFGTMIPEKLVIESGETYVFDDIKIGDTKIIDILTYMYKGVGQTPKYFDQNRNSECIEPIAFKFVTFESEIDNIASYSLYDSGCNFEFEGGIKGVIKSYGIYLNGWTDVTTPYDFTKITHLEDYAIYGHTKPNTVARGIKLDASKLEYIGKSAFNNFNGNVEFINSSKDSTHTITTNASWLYNYNGKSIDIPYEIDEFRVNMLKYCTIKELTLPRTTTKKDGNEIIKFATIADSGTNNAFVQGVTKITFKSGTIQSQLFYDFFGSTTTLNQNYETYRKDNYIGYLDLVLGEDVHVINSNAFQGLTEITTGLRYIIIENPNNITQLDTYIWDYLEKSKLVLDNHIYYLKGLAVGVNLTKANDNSAEGDDITELTFRTGTITIGCIYSDENISSTIKKIYLPNSVKNISLTLFNSYALQGLTDIYFKGTKAEWKEVMANSFADDSYQIKDLIALKKYMLSGNPITLHYKENESDTDYTASFIYKRDGSGIE